MPEDSPPNPPYHHGDLRAALLDAALEELEETGLDAFSLRKVARRAGVSHAAPAHHFGDVNGLLTALAARGYGMFVDAMQTPDIDDASAAQAAGLGYISFAERNQALFRLIFSSSRPDYENPELNTAANAAFSHLAGLIAARTGRDPMDDPSAMRDAYALWGMAHGLADLLSSGRLFPLQEMSSEARQAELIEILSRSLPLQA